MLADPLVSFAIRLRPHQWWYEVYTLAKRFALTSLVLAFPTLESYTVYVLATSVCALLLDREWASHIDKTVSSFNHALNVQVLLAPLVCYGNAATPRTRAPLLIQSNSTSPRPSICCSSTRSCSEVITRFSSALGFSRSTW